ncbi:AAA family ATPase [Paludibaculum fermentans]|uniref:AAA family ATPase n=1 Tax=Paludibaculum fermentans TaxID=1473598 RepID=UPI003EBA723B
MTETDPLRPLHLHTIDSLCADLISGRAIGVGKQNLAHSLNSAASRSILNWYRQNRSKWESNVMERDVELVAEAAAGTPPTLAALGGPVQAKAHRLRLTRIEAHQFGGLHACSSKSEIPANFLFEPSKPITLFEGWNGSGKTSLLNAIIWCLTGQLLRAQRKPEQGNLEFECRIERGSPEKPEESTQHKLTPVSPLPNSTRFVPDLAQSKLPIDTWVELTFEKEDGQSIEPIRRTQSRNSRGSVIEVEPKLAALGVDPIAVLMGTTMPGLIPFVQVGSVSELGQAVAQLTGLAGLVDLARHATRVQQRLTGDLTKSRSSEIERQDKSYKAISEELHTLLTENPSIHPAVPLPSPSADRSVEAVLGVLEEHFVGCKSKTLEEARGVLGPSFDPSNPKARNDLEANIRPALAQLDQIRQLESAARLSRLGKLGEEQLVAAEAIVSEVHEEASVLAELATTPVIARRKQLYARVASWMKEQELEEVTDCVVCGGSLDGAIDKASGNPVRDHLREMLEGNADLLGQTIRNWCATWVRKLPHALPEQLRPELYTDLPATPAELIRKALSAELFETLPFQGTLSSLSASTKSKCEEVIQSLPLFDEPRPTEFPPLVAESAKELRALLCRLGRVISFSRWRYIHREPVKEAFISIIGDRVAHGEPVGPTSPLRSKLLALHEAVENAQPITRAVSLCGRMSGELKVRREKEACIEAYRQAAEAITEVIHLGQFAQRQVEDLRSILEERAIHWRSRFYQNAYAFSGHSLLGTEMDSKGTVNILVGSSGTLAPAQHISNSSALRASLMGFFLAFWEYVLRERGGLQILLLDDPQELLDDHNLDRLARSLPELVEVGAQIFVTTHDQRFARMAVAEARRHSKIEHRSVHPVNSGRSTIATSPTVEALDEKRTEFENNPDVTAIAQDYVSEARVFIEARLADLFDDPTYPAYSAPTKAPTLADHLARLRRLVNSPPNDLFRIPLIVDFCRDQALAQDAACLLLLNKAHHNKANITPNEVFLVQEDLKRLRRTTEALHEEFRRWRWREPGPEAVAKVITLPESIYPTFSVKVYPDLAAFSGRCPGGEAQDCEDADFQSTWFEDKTFFYLKCEHLGFAAPRGSLVVVERDAKPGNDRNLVIALIDKKIYARRLLRSANGGTVSLAAENPNPRKNPPTLVVDSFAVRIHRIVGVLFEDMYPPQEKQDAVQLDQASILAQVSIAYRVRDDSALPLALPRQLVLGGPRIMPAELDGYEGKLVALTLDDGSGIFKRVGPQLPKSMAPLRMFESIGGLGASEIVATEDHGGRFSGVPVMAYARQVIGVVYEEAGATPRQTGGLGDTTKSKRADG